MGLQAYHLPNFFALLPKKPSGKISPHFKEAEIGFNTWAREKFDTRSTNEVLHVDLPLFTALAWPLAFCQQLRGIIDYVLATFILEKWTDHCSSAEALAWSELWIKTLRDGTDLEEERSRHPYIKMISSELVPNLKTVVGPFHWPQFVDGCEKFAMHVVQEALDREAYINKKTTHDIQSYTVMRRETIGVRPCFTLIQSTRLLYIPDDVLAHPVIREMEIGALDMFWIVNDVFSYKKEHSDDGALNNLLTAMQRDSETERLDLQGKLDYTEKLFRGALERFHTSRKNLPSLDQEIDQQVAIYVEGLIDLVVGNLEWSSLTHRYNTFMNDEDKKNNILRLVSG